ncbi:hypothetical protein AAMO2058_001008400 [Amorphochlora amoebiformis]
MPRKSATDRKEGKKKGGSRAQRRRPRSVRNSENIRRNPTSSSSGYSRQKRPRLMNSSPSSMEDTVSSPQDESSPDLVITRVRLAQPDTSNDAEIARRLQEELNGPAMDTKLDHSFAQRIQREEQRRARAYAPNRSHQSVRTRMRAIMTAREEIDEHGGSRPSYHIPRRAASYHVPSETGHLAAMTSLMLVDLSSSGYEQLSRLNQGNSAKKGMSDIEIGRLPTNVVKSSAIGGQCCICLEDEVPGQLVRRLPCMHAFHIKCIDAWLKQKGLCPICKKSANFQGHHSSSAAGTS